MVIPKQFKTVIKQLTKLLTVVCDLSSKNTSSSSELQSVPPTCLLWADKALGDKALISSTTPLAEGISCFDPRVFQLRESLNILLEDKN